MANNNRSSVGLRMKRKRSNSAISMTEGNVATEILSRLPARSLVRFKSVCKSWHALISDPYFLEKQSGRVGKKPQLLIMPFSSTNGLREIGFYAYGPASRLQAHLMSETKLPKVQKTLTRPQHVDGFLLLNTVTGLHISNPTTGEFITLPEGNSHVRTHRSEYNSRAGFGYVARDKCYKVAQYFYRWLDWSSKTYSLGLEVFELGRSGSSWRVVDEDPTHPIHTFSTPVSIGGVVYFKIDNRLHTSPPKGVLAFDLTHEKFKEIDRPSSFSAYKYNENGEVRILELEGELCFVGATLSSSRLDIWAYRKEEEGDVFSWVHTYSMVLPLSGTYAVPVGVSEGKLLLHLHYVNSGMHFLEFYDPRTGSFDKVVATLKDMAYFKPPDRYCFFGEEETRFQVIKYAESLASITTPRLTSP